MNKPTIRLSLSPKSNSDLLTFAQTVQSMMNGNSNYPSPANPTLLQLSTLITGFSDAVTAFGTTGNRGSHLQKIAVDTTRTDLENGLTSLASYVSNTTPYNEAAFISGGWEVKSEGTPVGIIQPVQDFHQFISRDIPSGAVKLKWKRPLATNPGSVFSYKILRSLTADVNAAVFAGISTKTTFTDFTAATRPSNFYWVIAVGAEGDGVVSDVVQGYPIGPVLT
jgi:hypothetical protein